MYLSTVRLEEIVDWNKYQQVKTTGILDSNNKKKSIDYECSGF